LGDQLLPEHWTKLYRALFSYLGMFGKFEIVFKCTDNVVHFFISSDKDLSTLSNSIEGIVLYSVDPSELNVPRTSSKERFVQFITGGNILDLKEKISIKRAKDLQYAKFKVITINTDSTITRSSYFFKNTGGKWSKLKRIAFFFPVKLLSVDFMGNVRYLKKTAEKYLDIEKSLKILSPKKVNDLFTVSTFPYFSKKYYLNITNYDFDKHSFIIGASGSGKSKFIGLFVDRLYQAGLKDDYRVIVIDPHASLAADFANIPASKIINFNNEGTELFAGAASDISAATELTAALFKSLMGNQYNSTLDRLLRFSLFVLFTAQTMSLDSLKSFLTDVDVKNQIIEHVTGYVPINVVKFFGADFNEMRTKYYSQSIAPLVALVDEMQLQPVLVGEGEISLTETIENNFLTVFSLNKVSMGERVVKTVAGLLIQQIFLLVQARAFKQKIILIIDEVSVVQNPALSAILSEARKFNLCVVLTQQYFGQIEKDLRDAIFSNVYNYYAFKVSQEDARSLEGNLNIELPKEIIEEEKKKGLKESDIRIKLMTELHPRECIVRVLVNGQIIPAIKARTVDVPASSAVQPGGAKINQQESKRLPVKFNKDTVIAPPISIPVPPPPASPPIPSQAINESSKEDIIESESLKPLPKDIHNMKPFIDNKTQEKAAGLFNLSDILAQQSPSRSKAHQRKEK
jgi:hypothetical protein